MRRLDRVFGVLLLGAMVTGVTVWAMGALYYVPLPPRLRGLLALTFGLAAAGAVLGLPHRRRTLLGFGLVWGTLVLWWSTISERRVPHGNEFYPAVLRQDVRPAAIGVG
jgi:hypothetical protein